MGQAQFRQGGHHSTIAWGEDAMVEQIWQDKAVTHRFSGQTSTEEIRRAANRVAGDSRFDEIFEIVYDFTACDGVTIRSEVVEEIAALDGAASITNPRIRITVITHHPEIVAAMETYEKSGLSNYPVTLRVLSINGRWSSLLAKVPPQPDLSFGC